MLLEGISGKRLDVNKAHKAMIASNSPAKEANKRGDGYVLILDSVTVTTADHLMALIINKDGRGRDLVVTHFNLRATSPDSGATSFLEVNLGGTFTDAIANSTETLPRNLRSGSPSATNICGAQCYVCDGVGDMTTEANAYIRYRGPRTRSGNFSRRTR